MATKLKKLTSWLNVAIVQSLPWVKMILPTGLTPPPPPLHSEPGLTTVVQTLWHQTFLHACKVKPSGIAFRQTDETQSTHGSHFTLVSVLSDQSDHSRNVWCVGRHFNVWVSVLLPRAVLSTMKWIVSAQLAMSFPFFFTENVWIIDHYVIS